MQLPKEKVEIDSSETRGHFKRILRNKFERQSSLLNVQALTSII